MALDNNDKNNSTEINGSWKSWGNYVIQTMNRLETKIDKVNEKYETIKNREHDNEIEIVRLKTKSAIWGALSGLVGSIIITLIISLSAGFIVDKISDDSTNKHPIKNSTSIEETMDFNNVKGEFQYDKLNKSFEWLHNREDSC